MRRGAIAGAAAIFLIAGFARGVSAQQLAIAPGTSHANPPARSTTATLATIAPVIDGRDDDAIWRTARAVTAFRQSVPVENGEPTFRTVAYFAYDAYNLYVFLRAFDPHPDSITAALARRDGSPRTDWLGVLVDSYHDRRTGYEFDVNPLGVKQDWAIVNDGDEDLTWDGIWDVATRIDSLGWTAEFRFPLSQLRYHVAPSDTFGIYVWRHVDRLGENSSWPRKYVTRPGLPSQFAELTGLDHLAPPGRAEVTPYLVTRERSAPATIGSSGATLTAGADVKYAVTANVTLNATVNPDFGQVEADPAELNLSTVETFLKERRPFFVQDAAVFNTGLNCGAYNCPNETLFYSRRIGRAPELGALYGDASAPGATSILGAAKVTGRIGGLAFGGFGAATERVSAPDGRALEPAAQYGMLRASEDFRHGESGVGFMVTAMQRGLDSSSAPYLHHEAQAGGVDFRHRFLGEYTIHGSAYWSGITGTPAAITATEREPIHNFQRPDGALVVDSNRTTLAGDDETLAFDKLGGKVQFQTFYSRRSPGFEVNDMGYLQLADQQSAYAYVGLYYTRPNRIYQRLRWNFNTWELASTAGLVTDRAFNTNVHLTLNNFWTLGAWIAWDGLGTTYCDRCARGGPAIRQDGSTSTWFDVTGDSRARLAPELTVTTTKGDAGRTASLAILPTVTFNASTRLTTSLGLGLTANGNNTQWIGNVVDTTGSTHYTFARLDQRTVSITARVNYTVSNTLSVQAYAQPFVSWGKYSDVRELGSPRAAAYGDRFRPYPAKEPTGFNATQLNANVVARWEYRPGSALFLVWTQARRGFVAEPGTRSALGNLDSVFSPAADNTFLVKLSYWFGR